MKTAFDIIQETEEAYSNPKNRAVRVNVGGEKACYYLQGNKMCAVGRCLINPPEEFIGDIDELEDSFGKLDEILKPEYRGQSKTFWRDLQIWHDSDFYFTDMRISIAGEAYMKDLKENY